MKAFTLIEILLVVIILAVLTGSAIPISINFYKTQQLDVNVKGVVQSLRRAQLKAMSIESDSIFGVYLTDDNYTLFKGSSFDARDISYDEVFDLTCLPIHGNKHPVAAVGRNRTICLAIFMFDQVNLCRFDLPDTPATSGIFNNHFLPRLTIKRRAVLYDIVHTMRCVFGSM